MPPTHITLHVKVVDLDMMLEGVVDEERVPIIANIGRLTKYLIDILPQEVRQLSSQQCAVFLERACEAGNKADLMRAYLGDIFTKGCTATALLDALSALTQKELSIEPLEEDISPEDLSMWIATVALALDTPTVTKLVVGTLLSIRYLPESERELRDLFLSLL